ncbi:MAG: hypothetical protein ACP5NC_06255 [Nitrososphaeria archaeon]
MTMTLRNLSIKIKAEKEPLGPVQRALFIYMFWHPTATLVAASREIKKSYTATTRAWERLKSKHDITKLCPNCFHETLYDGVCHTCGFVDDQRNFGFEASSSDHEPVYEMQPHGGLGAQTDYDQLKFKYGSMNIKHLVEHERDRRLESIKSVFMEQLKYDFPDPAFQQFAVRMLEREYYRFKWLYPDLMNARHFNSSFVTGVLKAAKKWR